MKQSWKHSLTRRQAGMSLGAAALMAENKEPRFDPVAYARWRHEQAPLRLRFAAKSPAQMRTWQKKLRAKLVELVGGFPAKPVSLNAQVLETQEVDGMTREKIIFTSREGMEVIGYLLKPKNAGAAPLPVMICVPGHGIGVEDVIRNPEGYMHAYALQVAQQGVAALAIEPLAFGHRRDPINAKRGPNANACQPAAGAALLFGETMIGWRVYDIMRAIDYVETRKDLNAKRVGCMGISGGGTCTLFAAALDERIQAALVSGYLCTFRDCILSLAHCMDNYVPGILNWAEMSDVASLIAPRAFFAESGELDRIFPIQGFREAFAAVEQAYRVAGAPQMISSAIHPGEHVFDGRQGLPFVLGKLKA